MLSYVTVKTTQPHKNFYSAMIEESNPYKYLECLLYDVINPKPCGLKMSQGLVMLSLPLWYDTISTNLKEI